MIEWGDLDSRLGARALGGWELDKLPDILQAAKQTLCRMVASLRSLRVAAYISLPTLPIPPISCSPSSQQDLWQLQLREMVLNFAVEVSANPKARFLSRQSLDEISPPEKRFDLRGALDTGFPYRLSHADHLATLFVSACYHQPHNTKKGIITDLDDTLWFGIVGEVGADAVSWSLNENAQIHGLYQQFLSSLSSAGILVAAVSKNSPGVVDEVFDRSDLVLKKSSVFPIMASWNTKSQAISSILQLWNISSDAVVF
ncbi:MAG: hypothetical protein ABI383_07720, partial [Acidobacteriaceae bacterium]